MIREFEIRNKLYNNELEGYLYYDESSFRYKMRILEDYTGKNPDIFFELLNERGIVDVPEMLVLDWIEARLIPPNRQNIKDILKDLGMKTYDTFQLLLKANGTCVMDYSYLKEIPYDGYAMYENEKYVLD